MRPPIHAVKHYVQTSLSTITGGIVFSITMVEGVNISAVNLGSEVQEGALVKAIFIEEWLRTGDTAPGSFITIVEKVGQSVATPTAAEMASLHTYGNKKNILFTSMGNLNDQDSTTTPVLRNWVKIPKGKQRIGLDDKIRIVTFAQTLDIIRCGFCTYKEYT